MREVGTQRIAKSSWRKIDPWRLFEQVVLVTGGSRGLGRAIAFDVADRGGTVAITYLKSGEEAEAIAGEINDAGGKAVAYQADVRDLASMERVIRQITDHFGRLTGVVNNAGIIRDKALMMMTDEDWRVVLETNLTGVFNTCRSGIVTLMKQRHGRIVNIASVSGLVGVAGQVNYSSSKAGIIGLTRALAKEVAAYGVTVNAVAPGYIDVGMATALTNQQKQKAIGEIGVGRFGTQEEVACLVSYLLSDAAAYITGQVITIDGGLSL